MESKRRRVRPREHFNGDVIRELREARGLSLDGLAQLVGTTKANVSKWELSRHYVAISFDLFMGLSRALYIAPEALADRIAAPPHAASGTGSARQKRP